MHYVPKSAKHLISKQNLDKMSKIKKLSDTEFTKLINESTSYNNFLKKIGMSHGRSSYDLIKERCEQLKIDTSHFKTSHTSVSKIPLDDILIENSTYTNNSRLATRLVNEKKLEYKCAICGNDGMWNNKPLSLQLDHINGNHKDNRIENLRFLCPNCHTQTDTYGSKCRAK